MWRVQYIVTRVSLRKMSLVFRGKPTHIKRTSHPYGTF